MSEWTLWLRDDNLTQVGMVGSFESFEMVLNNNDAGAWKLVCHKDSQAGEFLSTDPNQAIGVILKRDGVVLGSGFVTRAETHLTPNNHTAVFYGADDTALLGARLAVPDPWWDENAAGSLFEVSHDVRTGFADQVMAEYVDANLGPSAGENTHGGASEAHEDRMLFGLVVPRTGGFGRAVTYEARMTNLLQVCQDIAIMGGGLRFKIVNGPVVGQRAFVVDSPDDRSDQIVFAVELGTLTGVSRSESIPLVNYAFVGGQGEQELRTFIAAEDFESQANYGRWEMFVDQRQTSDSAVLVAALYKALEDGAEELSFDITPSTNLRDSFGTAWNVGSRVSVQIDTVRIPAYVSQVKIGIDDSGYVTVLPTVTTALLSKATRAAISVLNRRLNYLETSEGSWTVGSVIMWDRPIAEAPAGWAVCDGTGGTHDFTGRSPIGVGVVPGGGPTITLGGAFGAYAIAAHHHTSPQHIHTQGPTLGDNENGGNLNVGTPQDAAKSPHTHNNPDTNQNAAADTGDSGAGNTLHPVVGIYFLKRIVL